MDAPQEIPGSYDSYTGPRVLERLLFPNTKLSPSSPLRTVILNLPDAVSFGTVLHVVVTPQNYKITLLLNFVLMNCNANILYAGYLKCHPERGMFHRLRTTVLGGSFNTFVWLHASAEELQCVQARGESVFSLLPVLGPQASWKPCQLLSPGAYLREAKGVLECL